MVTGMQETSMSALWRASSQDDGLAVFEGPPGYLSAVIGLNGRIPKNEISGVPDRQMDE